MNDKHIVSAFDADLEKVQAHIMKMGGLVEEAILDASKSLRTGTRNWPNRCAIATRPLMLSKSYQR